MTMHRAFFNYNLGDRRIVGVRTWWDIPLKGKLLSHSNAIKVFPHNDWLCRFLYRHRELKQWLRYQYGR